MMNSVDVLPARGGAVALVPGGVLADCHGQPWIVDVVLVGCTKILVTARNRQEAVRQAEAICRDMPAFDLQFEAEELSLETTGGA